MFFDHVCAVLDVTSPDRIPSRLHFVRQLDDVRPERAHGSLWRYACVSAVTVRFRLKAMRWWAQKAPSVNLDKKAGFCVNASKFAGNNILYYLVSKDGELEIPVTTEGGKANSRMTW